METKTIETEQSIKYFANSGYKLENLQKLKEKAIANEEENTLIFPVYCIMDCQSSNQ